MTEKTKSKIKKKRPSVSSSIPVEGVSGYPFVTSISATINKFNFSPLKTFNKTGKSNHIKKAVIFALVINLAVLLYAHIFSTYLIDDTKIFIDSTIDQVADFIATSAVEKVQNFINVVAKPFRVILPAYPLAETYWIFAAPVLAVLLFLLEALILHLGVLPQKPKGNFRTTLKITAYSEAPKFYFIFFFIYLSIIKIPNVTYEMYAVNEDAYQTIFIYLFIVFLFLYWITKVLIIISGCRKLHKLEEPEAVFAAFWPLILYAIILLIIFVITLIL